MCYGHKCLTFTNTLLLLFSLRFFSPFLAAPTSSRLNVAVVPAAIADVVVAVVAVAVANAASTIS